MYSIFATGYTLYKGSINYNQVTVGVGDCYFNSFKSNSRGMAIFFNNTKTNVIVHNQISSIDESLLALDLSLNKQRFTLMNIYGPSDRDTPGFFQQLESIL